ncbi:MAG: hypothetical protein EOM15_10920 [Spirochaetia bacterium]|nr:hypothetical protein [Spirochaetia bacterium]
MNRYKTTFTAIVEEKLMQCIPICDQSIELPSYLLQKEKAHGYLYTEETLTPWYYRSITVVEGKRCLYFDPLDIFPFSDIATIRRDKALYWVRELAKTLKELPLSFLDLNSNILPLWRIWGVEDGSILILPQEVGDLFSSTADEEKRFQNVAAWVHHGIHPPFSLCDQMTSLLYFAAAGFAPFASKDTREDSFRALPLRLLQSNLNPKTIAYIDETLSLGLTKQRDATGNKESQKALSWFIDTTEQLVGELEPLAQAKNLEIYRTITACDQFVQRQQKRAGYRVFWRKKGWLVLTISAIVITLSYFTASRIKLANTPPYTAGMAPTEVVLEYFEGMNSLDLQKMEASLAKKTQNPSSMEVTNLFVTRQTRQAYEGINTQVDPRQWLEEGKPPIMEGTFLYGVTDVSVTALDDRTYRAQGILYTPYPYTEEVAEIDSPTQAVAIFTYQLIQDFTIEMGKKGWYEITNITRSQVEPLQIITVPTYQKGGQTILSQ